MRDNSGKVFSIITRDEQGVEPDGATASESPADPLLLDGAGELPSLDGMVENITEQMARMV